MAATERFAVAAEDIRHLHAWDASSRLRAAVLPRGVVGRVGLE